MSTGPLKVKCLASGSSGNVYLIQGNETFILVDCGLPARSIVGYLKRQRIDPRSLGAILITHEHTDHIQSAGTLSRRYGIPVVANLPTLEALSAQVGEIIPEPLPSGASRSVGGLEVTSFPTSHDSVEPVSYFVSCGEAKVFILTDTGTLLPHLTEPVSLADLVVLESNHDDHLLAAGPYPQFLKDRIMSNMGHLSNLQAAQSIAQAHPSRPQTVWLAHLSATNNNPTRARRTVAGFLSREQVHDVKLAVALRDNPSLSWSSDNTGRQMRLL